MAIISATMPWGEELHIECNFSDAASPIYYNATIPDEDGERWEHTPYQCADARHDWTEAVQLIIGYLGRDWYALPGDVRDSEDIIANIIADTRIVEITD